MTRKSAIETGFADWIIHITDGLGAVALVAVIGGILWAVSHPATLHSLLFNN